MSLLALLACNHHEGSDTSGDSSADTDGGEASGDVGGEVPEGAMRVFVTYEGFVGDLGQALAEIEARPDPRSGPQGVEAGDALCQRAADAVGLGGEWMALLQGEDGPRAARFPDVGPWVTVDGDEPSEVVFETRAALDVTHPLRPITVDEYGAYAGVSVWTGTANDNCFNAEDGAWSSTDLDGTIGRSGRHDFFWAVAQTSSCFLENSLYCFEVGGQPIDREPEPGADVGHKRAFVTAREYWPDFGSELRWFEPTAPETGAPAADRLCQRTADAVELGGTWRAYVSEGAHPSERIDPVGPWQALDGQRLLDTVGLEAVMNVGDFAIDERAWPPVFEDDVRIWTGADDGVHPRDDCNGWTMADSSVKGMVGDARSPENDNWQHFVPQQCSNIHHLLCLEQ